MDALLAARRCLPMIDRAAGLPPANEEFGRDHLRRMVADMQEWDTINNPKNREKAMRWLGYIQGCIVAGGGASLHEVKVINKES